VLLRSCDASNVAYGNCSFTITCMYSYSHLSTSTCIHTYIHAYIHQFIHTHTHTHTHTHKYVPKCHTSPSAPNYHKPLSDLPNLQYRMPQYRSISNDSDCCSKYNQVPWKIPSCNCGQTQLIYFKHESNVNNNVSN